MEIALIILAICYTANAAFVCNIQREINEIKQNLRQYFEQIDYKNLDLLMKHREDDSETPPNGGKQDINDFSNMLIVKNPINTIKTSVNEVINNVKNEKE